MTIYCHNLYVLLRWFFSHNHGVHCCNVCQWYHSLVVAPSLLPRWSNERHRPITAESRPSRRQIKGSSDRAGGGGKVTGKCILQLLVGFSWKGLLEKGLESTLCHSFGRQIKLSPCTFTHRMPHFQIVPNISSNGLSFFAPRIKHINHRFKRVVAGFIHWRVLQVRVLLVEQLLVIGGAPRGSLLVIRVRGRHCRRPHDVGPPLLCILIELRFRRI